MINSVKSIVVFSKKIIRHEKNFMTKNQVNSKALDIKIKKEKKIY